MTNIFPKETKICLVRMGPNTKKTNHKPYWVNEWGTVNETTNKQAKEQTYNHNNNDRLHFILTGQRFCSVVFLVTSWVIDVVLQTGEKRNLNISGLKKPVHLYIPQNSGNGSPADVTKNTVQYFVKPSYNIYESKLIQYHKINIPKRPITSGAFFVISPHKLLFPAQCVE